MKIKLNKKEQVALAHLVGNVAWYYNGDIGRLAERLFEEVDHVAFNESPVLVPRVDEIGFIRFVKRGEK